MEWAIAVMAFAVLGVTAAVAAGGLGEMDAAPDRDTHRQEFPDTPLSPEDVQKFRFGVAIRGYDMEQVDDVLARLSHEIADRDDEIDRLRHRKRHPTS